mgnify:CR=1 FL=1
MWRAVVSIVGAAAIIVRKLPLSVIKILSVYNQLSLSIDLTQINRTLAIRSLLSRTYYS